VGSEPLWVRVNPASGLLTQTWKELCPEPSSQTRSISTRSDQHRGHRFKDQERGPATQSPIEIHSRVAMRIGNATQVPRKGHRHCSRCQCSVTGSIQRLLHLIKRTRGIRGVPNVFPHLELRTSLLEAKKVDPHLIVAIKRNELGTLG